MNKKQYIAPAIEVIRVQSQGPLASSPTNFYDEYGYGQMSIDDNESSSMTNDDIWGKEW